MIEKEERARRAEWKPPAIFAAWLAVKRLGLTHRIEYRRDGARLKDAAELPGLWQELLDLTAQPDRDSPISGEYITTPASVPRLMAALGWQFPAFYTLSVQLSKPLGWEATIICRVVSVMARLSYPVPHSPCENVTPCGKNRTPSNRACEILPLPVYTSQK